MARVKRPCAVPWLVICRRGAGAGEVLEPGLRAYDFDALFFRTLRSSRVSCFASRLVSAAMVCLVVSLTIRTVPRSSRVTVNCRWVGGVELAMVSVIGANSRSALQVWHRDSRPKPSRLLLHIARPTREEAPEATRGFPLQRAAGASSSRVTGLSRQPASSSVTSVLLAEALDSGQSTGQQERETELRCPGTGGGPSTP